MTPDDEEMTPEEVEQHRMDSLIEEDDEQIAKNLEQAEKEEWTQLADGCWADKDGTVRLDHFGRKQ